MGGGDDEGGKENRAVNAVTTTAEVASESLPLAAVAATAATASASAAAEHELNAATSAQKLSSVSSPAALHEEATVVLQNENTNAVDVVAAAAQTSGGSDATATDAVVTVEDAIVSVDEKIACDDLAVSSERSDAADPQDAARAANEHLSDSGAVMESDGLLAAAGPNEATTAVTAATEPSEAAVTAITSTDPTETVSDDAAEASTNASPVVGDIRGAVLETTAPDETQQIEVETLVRDETSEAVIAITADAAAAAATVMDLPAGVVMASTDSVSMSAEAVASAPVVASEETPAETATPDDVTSEQWFGDDSDGDADEEDALIPVNTDDLSDDDPVFLGTSNAAEPLTLDSSDGAKRKRTDGDASDSTLDLESDAERKNTSRSSSSSSSSSNSSSGSSSSSSGSNSSSSASDSDSDSGKKHSRMLEAAHKKARVDAAPVALARPRQPRAVMVRQTLPPEFVNFGFVDRDGRDLPILRGKYEIKRTRRAVFSGFWGFSEADFAVGGHRVSKFEYTSAVLHGRRDGDRRPFSGKYSGFFNFRQFSGKVVRVKENQVELRFLKIARKDRESDDDEYEDDDSSYEEDETAQAYAKYEVYGKGRNRFGRFLIRGYLNPAASTIVVKRKYLE